MSIEHYQQQLLECVGAVDITIQSVATAAHAYTEILKAGEISKPEYQELMLDIQRKANIDSSITDLATKEKLNVAINGLISIIGMV